MFRAAQRLMNLETQPPTSSAIYNPRSQKLLAMSIQRTEGGGLLYLSLGEVDGGGITTLSSLKIVKELMHRVQGILGLSEPPRPSDCFDFIVGSGFGGIIALMLGRLRMTVDQALVSLSGIMEAAFSDKNNVLEARAAKFKSKNLKAAIAKLVQTYAGSSDARLIDEQTSEVKCKTFVCAMLANHHGKPVRLRTYWAGKNQTTNYTIREALLATCAIPQLFEPVALEELLGRKLSTDIFPNQHVACVLSIGAGQTRVADILDSHDRVLSKSDDVIDVLKLIAEDCESRAEDMAWRFRETTNLYFRFNVEQGMQSITESEWKRAPAVIAHTTAYKILALPNSHIFKVKTCPEPSPNFTGREEVLTMMNEYYFSDSTGEQRAFVLHGPTRYGKTQIARKFVSQYGHR
ncbi:FabD/lysophospholipase-like protein [Ceratobasidium sp. AG-I]|nr:FabD/lysophospholipase-like protein [Ceratobasidium sp. AG-I]